MRKGGARIHDDKGNVVKEEATQPHPNGNRPRSAKGEPLNVEVAEKATEQPKAKTGKTGQEEG